MDDAITTRAKELLASLPIEIWTESDDGQLLLRLACHGACRHTRLNATLARFDRIDDGQSHDTND